MVTRGEAMMAALVGGLTLAAAFPPWSAPLLAPLGLGAFFLAVSRRGVPSGAVTGFVFGLAFFGPTLWWLSSSIAPLAWAALVLLQAAWLAALGAGTALLGEKAAMACTVAVEEVIDEHYAGQVKALDADKDAGEGDATLRDTLEEFRLEEVEHKQAGLAHGAEDAPGYEVLTGLIKTGSRLAIWLSTRI